MKQELVEKCKFIAYILRHGAVQAGVSIDKEGWVSCDELLDASYVDRYNITYSELLEIVRNNDKKRFELSERGDKIRAFQGHSSKVVDRTFKVVVPTKDLFHGTSTRTIKTILKEGLKKMSRQYVHLSPDTETATSVGERYGKVVLLKINALQMLADGFEFFETENGVWLVDHVPVKYIEVIK